LLFRLEESGDYVAFPVGVTQDEAEALVNRGQKKKVKASGMIAIAVITAITIMLLLIIQDAITPIAPIAVLIFGLSLLKFYNSTVELVGRRLHHRRLRRLEETGKLVWVLKGLKLRADKVCELRGVPVPTELFSYDMPAARSLAVLYRRLKKLKDRQQSVPLREQLDALITNKIAADA
jgi:hypothetical protein